jgi:D-arabinose 1-dehydrogenase-like Zn-dependent alcohol dehydrogenase
MSGFGRDGFFQEYVTTNWRNAIVLPSEVDIYEAAPLFCAGITSWEGVIGSKINPGEWMAIIGCGGLGHLGWLKSVPRQVVYSNSQQVFNMPRLLAIKLLVLT